jgi:DNA-binding PadR family transcriptional regulator
MATTTPTSEIAVLGALSVEPMNGYELRRSIGDVLGHFWSESFGQIYPALSRLHKEGLVEARPGGRPGSTEYTTTKAGDERLAALLNQPIKDRPPRNGTLLRLFFGRHLGPDRCEQLVDETEANTRAQLAHLLETRREVEAEATPDTPYFLITIDLGIRTCEAALAWAETARLQLQQLGTSTAP